MNPHGSNTSPAAKKPLAAKAAAQRLAQVMSHGGDHEDKDEDDGLVDSGSKSRIGLGGKAAVRPISRALKSIRPSAIGGRLSISLRAPLQISSRAAPATRVSPSHNNTDQIPSRPSPVTQTSPPNNNVDQTPLRPSPVTQTSPSPSNIDQTPSSPLPVTRTSPSPNNVIDETPSSPLPVTRVSPSPSDIVDETPSRPSPVTQTAPSPNNSIDETPSSALPVTRTSPPPSNVIDQTPVEKSPEAPAEKIEITERSLSIRIDRQHSNRPSSPFGSNRPSSPLGSSLSRSASERSPSPALRAVSTGRPSPVSTNSVADIIQPGRSPMPFNHTEQPPSARSKSAGRPGEMETVPVVPSAVNISSRHFTPASPAAYSRNKRWLTMDLGSMKIREPQQPNNQVSSAALHDQHDRLQEENDSLIEKLRLAEERLLECEARSRHLEKQVANLGEGVSMEARFLNRKEASLQQREAALRAASQTRGSQLDQIATITSDVEKAKEEANSVLEKVHDTKSELSSLRLVVQRLVLTEEEMEEVVLKRCWLARYWGLCAQYGIYPGVAEAKHEYWSSFAPLPLEFVIATGLKAKDDTISANNDREEKQRHFTELSGEGNAETMLMLDRGLKELAQLKVEDAIRIAMAQQRKKNSEKTASTEDSKSPSQKYVEGFELTQEESEEVQFKQYWLIYFWRRAKNHGLESDIADDRLQYWINNTARAATAHDAVDVERGIVELRKLGIETQLWEENRRWLEQDAEKKQTDF